MNALIGLEGKSELALSSSGIGLPQPGQPHRQQPRDPGPALLRGHPLRGNLFYAVLHQGFAQHGEAEGKCAVKCVFRANVTADSNRT